MLRIHQEGKRTNVCTVDEAEKVQQGHGRDDHEIDLGAQPPLGLFVDDDCIYLLGLSV